MSGRDRVESRERVAGGRSFRQAVWGTSHAAGGDARVPRGQQVGTARILIADNQQPVCDGFRFVLDAQPGMAVIGEARSGRRAVELARHLRPDIVLADVDLPGVDGLEVTRSLAAADVADSVRVIVTSAVDREEYATEALRLGASGFLLKDSAPALLVEAVRAALAGGVLVSPRVNVRLLRRLVAAAAHHDAGDAALTDREVEVACGVAKGLTNAEIASELYVTAGTVKTHLAKIQTKLGVRNRVGIAAWAWAHGYATASLAA
jgi:DNA-binding NarL/FixJ family response regulator